MIERTLLIAIVVLIVVFAFGDEVWEVLDSIEEYPKDFFLSKWTAYGITDRYLCVFNISNPHEIEKTKEMYLGDYLEDFSCLEAITGDDRRLYLLYDEGVLVFDITMPESPRFLRKIKSPVRLDWISGFTKVANSLIVTRINNVFSIDISSGEVRKVLRLGNIEGEVQYSKSKSLLVIPTIKGTAFLRINPSTFPPTIVNNVVLGDPSEYLWIDGSRVYTVGNEYMDVFDISDPDDPKLLRRFDLDDLLIEGSKAFAIFSKDDVLGIYFRKRSGMEGGLRIFDMRNLDSPKILLTTYSVGSVNKFLMKGDMVYYKDVHGFKVAKLSYVRGEESHGNSQPGIPDELIECKAYFIFSQLKRGTRYKIVEFTVFNDRPDEEFKLFSLTHPGEIRDFVSYSPTKLCVRYTYERENTFGSNGMIIRCWKCRHGVIYKVVAHPYADWPEDLVEFLPKEAY